MTVADVVGLVLHEHYWYPVAVLAALTSVVRRFVTKAPGATFSDVTVCVSFVAVIYAAVAIGCVAAEAPGAIECLQHQHGFFLVVIMIWVPIQVWRDARPVLWPPPGGGGAGGGAPPPPPGGGGGGAPPGGRGGAPPA